MKPLRRPTRRGPKLGPTDGHGPKPAEWRDLGERDLAVPHFQSYQFDPSLPRHGRDMGTDLSADLGQSLSPEANCVVYGDKSLRSKIANLLSGPAGSLSVFEAAAFRC